MTIRKDALPAFVVGKFRKYLRCGISNTASFESSAIAAYPDTHFVRRDPSIITRPENHRSPLKLCTMKFVTIAR